MRKALFFLALTASTGNAAAQDYVGPASLGSQETLFPYDDQEPWKHGYRQVMPYYGGWHAFRPYNYHHVFGQAQTAATWGMAMPYSQQFWHRYQLVPGGNVTPLPQGYGPPAESLPPHPPAGWAPPAAYGPPQSEMIYGPPPHGLDPYAVPEMPAPLPAPVN
jgi:hypothetical protein